MKTFKFPEFFDKHLPAKYYGDWRRALMKDVARLMIVDVRKETKYRLEYASFELGYYIGVRTGKFEIWMNRAFSKKNRRTWDSLVVEAYELNKDES